MNIINFKDVETTLKQINKLRKANKNKWVFIQVKKENKILLIKSFNTSIQQLIIEGVNYGGVWDLKVREYTEKIKKALHDLI